MNVLIQVSLMTEDRRKFRVNFTREMVSTLFETKLLGGNKRVFIPDIADEDYKDNFNIIVGKIKNFLRADYLLGLLNEKDDFLHVENTSPSPRKKTLLASARMSQSQIRVPVTENREKN
jgi:hypothetical protein